MTMILEQTLQMAEVWKNTTLHKEEVKMAIDTCKALNLDFGGVDILFGENGPILL